MRATSRVVDKKLQVNNNLNKGCISAILPKEQMPYNEYGEHADLILNSLGVIGRLNIAQLYETELNFISDNIIRKLKNMNNIKDREDYLFDYIGRVNSNQKDEMKPLYDNLSDEEKEEFFEDIFTNGIKLHQPPFYGNITFDQLGELYEHYKIEKYQMYWDGKPIDTKMTMGNMYMIRLKQDPRLAFSARSSGFLSMYGTPGKSSNYISHQSLYSNTPIRVGEMEFNLLALIQDIENVVKRFLDQYSSNPDQRKHMIKTLLTENVFNIEKIESIEEDSITSIINKTYLKCLSLELKKIECEEVK